MKAIILAAGIGNRMGKLTEHTPKCLLKINKKTLLEDQLGILKKQGIKKNYIVIGYKGTCWNFNSQNKIKEINPNVIVNYLNIEKNCSYSLQMALKNIVPEDLLIIDGDIYFKEGTIKKLLESQHRALVSKICRDYNLKTNRVLADECGVVKQVGRGISSKFVHAGIIKIKKEDIEKVQASLEKNGYEKDLAPMISDLSKLEKIHMIIDNSIININTEEDLKSVKKLSKTFQKGVIFDFDGVIVKSSLLQIKAYKESFKKFGLDIRDEDYLENDGLGAKSAFELITQKYNIKIDFEKWHEYKKNIYSNLISTKIEPVQGIVRLLKILKERKYALAIASSGSKQDIHKILEKIGIKEMFKVIVSQEETIKGKPDAEPFLKAAERLEIPPENCLVVEDSIYGVAAAKSGNMRCIALVTTGNEERFSDADLIVTDLKELNINMLSALFK